MVSCVVRCGRQLRALRWRCLHKLLKLIRTLNPTVQRNMDTFMDRLSSTESHVTSSYFVLQFATYMGVDVSRVQLLLQRLFVSFDLVRFHSPAAALHISRACGLVHYEAYSASLG